VNVIEYLKAETGELATAFFSFPRLKKRAGEFFFLPETKTVSGRKVVKPGKTTT
jgi:hypothetical protein